jgi:hypothetical protein
VALAHDFYVSSNYILERSQHCLKKMLSKGADPTLRIILAPGTEISVAEMEIMVGSKVSKK